MYKLVTKLSLLTVAYDTLLKAQWICYEWLQNDMCRQMACLTRQSVRRSFLC